MFHHRSDSKKENDKDKDKKKVRESKKKESPRGKEAKKAKVKIAYELVVKGIDQLKPDDNGKKIQVTWKRGRKSANKGKTKPVTNSFPTFFASRA